MNANKREKTKESVVCNIQYQYYIVHMHMQSAELYNATAMQWCPSMSLVQILDKL